MGQSRFGSVMESVTDTVISFFIALATQMIVFPYFGIHMPVVEHMQLVGVFTGISLARRYVIRRWFNSFSTRGMKG